VYNPKYNKNNYLELEEELDVFSFDEWTSFGIIYELFRDGIITMEELKYPSKKLKTLDNDID
jgi:hypothetical protein